MRKRRLLAYVILTVSVLMSVKLVKDIFRLWHADDRLKQAQLELVTAKETQVKLRQKLKAVEGAKWWEEQVRNTLKMARSNEEVVIVPDEIKDINSQGVILGSLKNNKGERQVWQKWWQLLAD